MIQLDEHLGGFAILLNTYATLYAGIQYQWLGEPIDKVTEGQWISTANLSTGLYSNIPLSNSFGYMIRDWLSIYGGVQVIRKKYITKEKQINIHSKTQNKDSSAMDSSQEFTSIETYYQIPN